MMNAEALAKSWWFVIGAYFAAFLPWTALTNTDFMSSKWVSVRKTRKAGYRNLVYTFLPMSYVIVYAVVQAMAGEYSEMCAAAVAIVFAALVGMRTLWGLWQLRAFRIWAHRSIDALRSVGVPYTLRHLGEDDENHPSSQSKLGSAAIADEILVNEKIADNQILHGDVQCHVEYGGREVLKPKKNAFFDRRFERVWVQNIVEGLGALTEPVREAIRWIEFISTIVFKFLPSGLATIARRNQGGQSKRKVRQVPVDPVQVWVHWAATFASQGLQQWMSEFEAAQDPNVAEPRSDESTKDRFLKRGRYFGSQLLASAMLQVWDEGGASGSSPFLWKQWGKNSEMSDGRFVKQELLREALENGRCLSFEASHIGNLSSRTDQSGKQIFSFGAYEDVLREFISDLPVQSTFVQEMREFDVEKLEWLTILLHLGSMAEEEKKGSSDEARSRTERRHRSNDGGSETVSKTEWNLDNEKTGEEDARSAEAVKNLWLQLGMSSSNREGRVVEKVERSEQVVEVSGIPLMRHVISKLSTANRSVCRVGQVVDVWLSLVCGEQMRRLVELNDEWGKVCIGRKPHGTRDVLESPEDEDGNEEREREDVKDIRQAHKELEVRRLELRMASNALWRYDYLDACATFMGYRMETVRTVLGRCVRRMGNRGDSKLFADVDGDTMKDIALDVDLSEDMRDVLRYPDCVELLERQGVKCRLVWELQDVLERKVMDLKAWKQSDGQGESKKMEVEVGTIMLMMLSFPGVHVSVPAEPAEDDDEAREEKMSKDWCCIDLGIGSGEEQSSAEQTELRRMKIRLEAICSPQKMWIEAEVNGDGDCCLKVVSIDQQTFEWKWWRDAFLGRMEGLRVWQESMGIEAVKLDFDQSVDGAEPMMEGDSNENGKIMIWKEWLPFRISICRLELDGKDVLKQLQKKKYAAATQRSEPLIRSSNWDFGSLNVLEKRSVSYSEAKAHVLRDWRAAVKKWLSTWELSSEEKGGEEKEVNDGEHRQNDAPSGADNAQDEDANDGENSTAKQRFSVKDEHYDSDEEETGRVMRERLASFARGESSESGVREILELTEGFFGNMLERKGGELRVKNGKEAEIACLVERVCERQIELSGDAESSWDSLVRLLVTCAMVDGRQSKRVMILMQQLLTYCTTWRKHEWLHAMYSIVDIKRSHCKEARSEESESLGTRQRSQNNLEQYRAIVSGVEQFIAGWQRLEHGDGCEIRADQFSKRCQWLSLKNRKTISPAPSPRRQLDGNQARFLFRSAGIISKGLNGAGADAVRAVALYQRAIKDGKHVSAMFNLGLLLSNGAPGVPADAVRAAELYQRAIDNGNHVLAMDNLGVLLSKGAPGVSADAVRAVELYQRAIDDGGYVPAMYNLGLLLSNGAPGVPADAVRAVELYQRAIDDGNDLDAMFSLANLLKNGAPGVSADASHAMELYEKAIDSEGEVRAIYHLGMLLEKGAENVSADVERAKQLFERAVREGNHEGARNRLRELENRSVAE